MGDQQRAGPSVEEGACQTRQRLGPLRASSRRVAGRQEDPIGISRLTELTLQCFRPHYGVR